MFVAGCVQLLRRFHLELSVAQEAQLDAAVRRAVLEAEEWAAARVKAKLPATSYQKLDRAADALIPAFGLTPEEAEGRIKAALPQLGLGATNPSFSQPLATADSSHP